jgi:hypothetical protein
MEKPDIIFTHYGVDHRTGNNRKVYYCFKHAVRMVMDAHFDVQAEIVETNIEDGVAVYPVCIVCSGGDGNIV